MVLTWHYVNTTKNKTVEQLGANNPLIHISGEIINKMKGDSQLIGIYSGKSKF